MRIAMFYHSLVSDWNHGNAHFLRGVVTELRSRGHRVQVYEPKDSWSRINLVQEHGTDPIDNFRRAYPGLSSIQYHSQKFDLDRELDGVDLVIVHEWNAPELVRRIGEHHRRNPCHTLLFHDTHHRMVTDPKSMEQYALGEYDGVLAYGNVLRELYEITGRVRHAWTWHEAADTRVFRPRNDLEVEGDLVWVGNWGDDERSAELQEFLVRPIRNLKLKARIWGVRYPEAVRKELAGADIEYRGWLPNFEAPAEFARHKVTVHVPRRPYVKALPGIPTIRPFEALACGIPLVSSPWNDSEGLFRPGIDYLEAKTGSQMEEKLRTILSEPALAQSLRDHGLETIRTRHTCAHRVDELLEIVDRINPPARSVSTDSQKTLLASANVLL
jgi:spore maturation protein CgeB